ncbi:chloride channel protein [Acidocella sp.]|uniref:chloride channel protein n=3 Tax=Acidocella sp. TaxID=50710 RepID=UPI002626C65E|nr:chloride channel protein [Acidocella sp.]
MKKAVRRLRVLRRLWGNRVAFWVGALVVGMVSVGFAAAADWAQSRFFAIQGRFWLAPVLLTPLGFVVCAHLARVYFPGSQGSGIPQAIAARHLGPGPERQRLLSLRICVGKIGLTLIALLCGASVGREGPTVQVGAALMLQISRLFGTAQQRGLILAGSAAGIAAAFNAPLAGVVFAIEEMSRAFEARTNSRVITTVILSGLISLGLEGNYIYFGVSTASFDQPHTWMLVAFCGLGGGLAGGLFARLMFEGTLWLRGFMAVDPLRRQWLVPLACGVIVMLCGLVSHGATFGTGYDQAKSAIEGASLPNDFWALKLIATLVTAISGLPGGIFAPSLAVGAGLGAALAGAGLVGAGAVLGMTAYFAGVVGAPMTAFVIVLEMTGNAGNAIPVMLSAMLGVSASKLVNRTPLYHALSELFLPPRPSARVKHPQPAQPPESASPPGPAVG